MLGILCSCLLTVMALSFTWYVVCSLVTCCGWFDNGQYWACRTPRLNNGPPNMAAANFVVNN